MPSADSLRCQLQSARKSILFMETEHAKTLRGLHDEIKSLQKRCTDLTFQLTMKEDEAYSDDVRARIEMLELDAQNSSAEKVSLMQQLESKERLIFDTEQKAKSQEIAYKNDVKEKGHQLVTLAGELDQRATTIAYMSSQLHQAHSKIQFMQQQQLQLVKSSIPTVVSSSSQKEPATERPTASVLKPKPPPSRSLDSQQQAASSRLTSARQRRVHSGGATRAYVDLSDALTSEGNLRRHHSRRPLSSSSESQADPLRAATAVPDPAPFLEHRTSSGGVLERRRTSSRLRHKHATATPLQTVLPPIMRHNKALRPNDTGATAQNETGDVYEVEPGAAAALGDSPPFSEASKRVPHRHRRMKGAAPLTYNVPEMCTTTTAASVKQQQRHHSVKREGLHKT